VSNDQLQRKVSNFWPLNFCEARDMQIVTKCVAISIRKRSSKSC